MLEIPAKKDRFSLNAMTVGAITSVALMTFLMSFKSNSIFGDSRLTWLAQSEVSFWVSAVFPWMASVFVGAFIATFIGRIDKNRDGLLLGFATWAASLLLFGVLTSIGSLSEPPIDFQFIPPLFGVGFLANGFAIVTGAMGGSLGARLQIRTPKAVTPNQREKGAAHGKPVMGNVVR